MHSPSLSHYTLVTVKGPDAEKFLQGQCTCDFSKLASQTRLLGAHCNHQGRMHSNFVAARLDENTIGLRFHKSIAQNALNALKKYIVFSKADIAMSEYALLGLVGPKAKALAEDICKQELTEKSFAQNSHCVVVCHSPSSYEIWCPPDQLDALLEQTSKAEISSIDDELWLLESIRRGEAIIHEALELTLLPQEINLQLTDGIAFNKGCYTGQEVIARLHYKAQLKKHLYRGTLPGNVVPLTNSKIYETGLENEKAKGIVINSARTALDTVEFLALCSDELINKNNACIPEISPTNIQWLRLPYAIN